MTTLLHKAAVRRYVLLEAKRMHNGRFTRVSPAFIDGLDGALGKTLK